MRWMPDEIDLWCQDWARQRRQMLGLDPLEPRDRIGKLNSTLGAIKSDQEGASQGSPAQTFPEVYRGMSLLVHRAVREMNPSWAAVLSEHYVNHRDRKGDHVPVKIRARNVGLEPSAYWKTLALAKGYVHSFVTITTKYATGETPKTIEMVETRLKALSC